MKKIILILLLSILILSGCSDDKGVEVLEKKDFYIDVKKIGDFDNIAYLNKTGKIDSTQNITLNSNANGRVKSILVKNGENVLEGQLLAVLEDNLANYNLNLEVAENALDASKNALDVTKNNLSVSENNLEKARLNYESTKLKLDKSIGDIERSLNNLNTEDETTSTSIEINKIDNSISRLNLEYDNLIMSNDETLSSFKRSLEKEITVLNNYLSDIIYFSDEILGVTELNKNKNNSYEIYLGAKDSAQKLQSESLLKNLISEKDTKISSLKIEILSEDDYKKYTKIIDESYNLINDFLTSFDNTLSNTVPSVGAISEAQISGYKAQISGYKATYNGYKSSFLGLSNSIYSFLETYKNSQNSLLKQIENLEKDKSIYLKSLDLNKTTSKSTLDEAISNRDLTLKNLDLVIKDAEVAIVDSQTRVRDAEIRVRDSEINYKKALNEAEKLFIKSPISGIIGNILIDRGQEIFSGTPAFNILSEGSKEVTISFNKDELDYVSEGSKAYYTNELKTFTGTIYSITKSADENLKYQAKVTMPNEASNIGNILNLNIPITLEHKLLPVNIVKINSFGMGSINYYSTGGTIEKTDVKVGKVYGDEIELLGENDPEIRVILNYVDNFDSEKFILKVKE
ncbi:MAG: HlyD family efflux transporter periplasmic adaptor subunit [Candidatus Gracilibacteria bacterium]|nr:HlyD family efflux transporter periplasmic adaptor subunit [Candidatus Gracilibacteria bacterium]